MSQPYWNTALMMTGSDATVLVFIKVQDRHSAATKSLKVCECMVMA